MPGRNQEFSESQLAGISPKGEGDVNWRSRMLSGLNEKSYTLFYKDICLNIIRSVSYTMVYSFYHRIYKNQVYIKKWNGLL